MTHSRADESSAPPHVFNASDIHTQGNNFLHTVQTSADPRTGQFNMAITVPLGQANFMGGPNWSFTLSYSILSSQQDSGFGLGWSLQSTQLTRRQNIWTLRLSSGEQFVVDLSQSDLQPGGRLVLEDFKLESMQVTRLDSDDPNGEMRFRILHKTGEMEFLQRLNGSGDTYLLYEMRSAEGHRLHFDWLRANDLYHLMAVRDEQRTLLRYDRMKKHVILEPGSPIESTLQLVQSNGELSRLILPEIDIPFVFHYINRQVGDQFLRLPDRLSGPLGALDTINWSSTLSASHALPKNAPLAFVPRVISWLHSDGPFSTSLLRRYGWSGSRNYLGGGSSQAFDWEAGHDSLYRLTTRYEYSNTETQISGDLRTLEWLQATERLHATVAQIDTEALLTTLLAAGVVAENATITRTWDRHHLLIKEVTLSGTCETTRETQYGVDYAKTWKAQVPQCQLPHQISTTYRDTLTDRTLTELTTHEYDTFGNTLRTCLPTLVEEVSDYYPASGELKGCPADASGMVRFLKRKTIHPSPDCPGEAPTLYTYYEYEALPSLITGDPEHAVACLEQLGDACSEEVIESTEQSYERQQGEHYGRQKKVVTTLNGKSTTTLFDYRITRNANEPPLLWTTTKTQGFENNELTITSSEDARSLLSGLTHCQVSTAGVRTFYTYDRLGRVIRTLIAQGTAFEVERTCNFHLDDEFVAQHAPRIGDELTAKVALEETDATGQRKRTWLDGSSRAVLIQLEDIDNSPDVFRDVTVLSYDAWGREIEDISKDWDSDGECLFALTSGTAYDDWGFVCRQTHPTGVMTHTLTDPTRRTVATWQEGTDGTLTSRQTTTSNAAGSPLQTVRSDEKGQTAVTTRFTRDGLDRVIEMRTEPRDGLARITEFEYDCYSRLTARLEHIRQSEEDEDYPIRITRWQYAAHSDAEHPEALSVEVVKSGDEPAQVHHE